MKQSNFEHQLEKPSARLVLPGLALFVCAGLTAWFWPGVGTWEVLQFEIQRQLPVMNDWKSPFVAYIYWLADYGFNSTGPVLLFQQALFWLGLALLARHTLRNPIAGSIFFLIVASLPLVWTTEILLWKEAWTLSFLTLSLGAIFACINTGNPWYAVTAVIAAILLAVTRQNAVLLAFPAFYVSAQLFATRSSWGIPGKHRLIVTLTVTLLVLVTLFVFWVINKKGIQRCHIWHHALLWDLAALSLSEGEMMVPDEFRKGGEAGSLKSIGTWFTYYNSDPLFFGQRSPLKLYGTAASPCDQQVPLDILLEHWSDAVRTYPGAYLRHRLIYLAHLLGIPNNSRDYWGRKYYRNDSEYSSQVNQSARFERLIKSPVYKLMVSGRMLPGWLFVMVFLGSVLGLSRRRHTVTTCLWLIWLSGLAYLGSFVAIGSGAVMRYLAVYAVLGPAILAGRWSIYKNQHHLK